MTRRLRILPNLVAVLAVASSAVARPAFADGPAGGGTSSEARDGRGLGTEAPATSSTEPKTKEQLEAQQHFQRAKDLYQTGAYREAIAELEQARGLDPKAKDLVFNLGIVHEKLGKFDEAIAFFRQYMEMEGVSAVERGKAENIIKRIEGAKREVAAPSRPSGERVTTEPRSGEGGEQQPGNGRIDAATIAAGSVAVVGLGLGATFGILALSTKPSGFVTGRDGTYDMLQSKTSSAHTEAVVADVGFGVGIAAAVVTAYLYLGRSKEAKPRADRSRPPRASVAPTLTPSISASPTGGAVILGGTFLCRSSRGTFARGALYALLASAGVGCSLIVSGDVPDFECSGTSDSACPSGMTCSASGRCVVADGSVEPPEAGDEESPPEADAPEVKADADAMVGPADLGEKCRVDADCKSRLCASSTVLTTVITSSTGPICTTPCCTSNECSAGFVCFNGGTGGGYCVSAMLAQRMGPGVKAAGLSCSVGSECRSGLCAGSPKTCVDTCCGTSDCGGSSTCRVATVSAPAPAHDIWVCAPPDPAATSLPGDSCIQSTDCRSEDCVGTGGGRVCRPTCSNTAACRTVSGFETGHCLYGPSGSDFLKFCFVGTTTTDKPAGTACADNSECQSDYCDAELKKCANVCGRDLDCESNETCRPSATGTPFLRCVPKP